MLSRSVGGFAVVLVVVAVLLLYQVELSGSVSATIASLSEAACDIADRFQNDTHEIPPAPREPERTRRRILVVVLSETRAWKLTYDRFAKNVLDHLGADLALCVADKEVDLNNSFYRRANYTWVFPDLEDWGDAFEMAYRARYLKTGAKWRDILNVGDQFMGGVKGCRHQGSAAILLFMRWWLDERLAQLAEDVIYDWYVVTRSDYYYLHPHPDDIFNDSSAIWVPEGEDYGGVTDRHAVLPRAMVRTWLDFVEALMRDPSGVRAKMEKQRSDWNLEKVLKWRLEENGVWNKVRRFKQGMFTVRDAETKTRWSSGTWNPEMKMFIKYHGEYVRALSFLQNPGPV